MPQPPALQNQIYVLQSYGDEFYTGSNDDCEQVIIGLHCPHIVAYFFDEEGTLVNKERQLWKHPAPRINNDGPYNIYDKEFVEAINQQTWDWMERMGFQEESIKIRKFTDETMGVGISELPTYLKDLDPDEEDMQEALADWLESGNFVFCWGKEYHMAPDGEVEST
ncbi:MAG: hypothetical protein K2W95_25665 [Candidatus Obscuribacterales bacterium]|nr:hypothetical protein [Candidatus Obscuribacterales bacterium]